LAEAEIKKDEIKELRREEQAELAAADPVAAFCSDDAVEEDDDDFMAMFTDDIPSPARVEPVVA